MDAEQSLHGVSLPEPASLPRWLPAALGRRFGTTEGTALSDRVGARYAGLLVLPSPFADPRERAFANTEILPLLALYLTLLADGLTAEAAETEVRRLRAQALRERPVPGVWLTAHAPGRQHWRRWLVRREVAAAFPLPTFRLVTTRDEADTLEFEVRRCPYGAALAAYGAPELLATFCRLDEVRFDALVSAVTCEHHQAGDGGACRFCFRLYPDNAALEEARTYLEM